MGEQEKHRMAAMQADLDNLGNLKKSFQMAFDENELLKLWVGLGGDFSKVVKANSAQKRRMAEASCGVEEILEMLK